MVANRRCNLGEKLLLVILRFAKMNKKQMHYPQKIPAFLCLNHYNWFGNYRANLERYLPFVTLVMPFGDVSGLVG